MQPLGYTYLMQHFDIELPRLGLDLYQGKGNRDELRDYSHSKSKLLAASKATKIAVPEQIELAIKHQGIRLPYLAMVFDKVDQNELTRFIKRKPTGKIHRAIWYLYEWYTGIRLELEDLAKSRYVQLLEDTYYYTKEHGEKCPRTKIINNMLGNRQCCPMVRKTPEIKRIDFEKNMEETEKGLDILNKKVSTDQLGRSLNYLYLKETKSSTEIEREDSSQHKTQRFFQILKSAGSIPLSKQRLLTIQNQIVPASRRDEDYRQEDIWVGEHVRTRDGMFENFHFIAPKKEHVQAMMEGLLEMHEGLLHEPQIPALLHAAVVSFMFVYIHPFSDGNGRTHRYLIHDIVKSRRAKKDFIVPISAAILNNMREYDQVLESVSKPVMALLQYEYEEDKNTIRIDNDISHMYQFPDLTEHVIFLNKMMQNAFGKELFEEILYVLSFDTVKRLFNDSFDIGEKDLSNYVNWLMQNEGKFALKKRKQVAKLHNENDIALMESIAIDAIAQTNQLKETVIASFK